VSAKRTRSISAVVDGVDRAADAEAIVRPAPNPDGTFVALPTNFVSERRRPGPCGPGLLFNGGGSVLSHGIGKGCRAS
jgi:hypothetical protein